MEITQISRGLDLCIKIENHSGNIIDSMERTVTLTGSREDYLLSACVRMTHKDRNRRSEISRCVGFNPKFNFK